MISARLPQAAQAAGIMFSRILYVWYLFKIWLEWISHYILRWMLLGRLVFLVSAIQSAQDARGSYVTFIHVFCPPAVNYLLKKCPGLLPSSTTWRQTVQNYSDLFCHFCTNLSFLNPSEKAMKGWREISFSTKQQAILVPGSHWHVSAYYSSVSVSFSQQNFSPFRVWLFWASLCRQLCLLIYGNRNCHKCVGTEIFSSGEENLPWKCICSLPFLLLADRMYLKTFYFKCYASDGYYSSRGRVGYIWLEQKYSKFKVKPHSDY